MKVRKMANNDPVTVQDAIEIFDFSATRTNENHQTKAWAILRAEIQRLREYEQVAGMFAIEKADLRRERDTLLAENARLNKWADGFSDAQLKERATGEAYQRELRDEIAKLKKQNGAFLLAMSDAKKIAQARGRGTVRNVELALLQSIEDDVAELSKQQHPPGDE